MSTYLDRISTLIASVAEEAQRVAASEGVAVPTPAHIARVLNLAATAAPAAKPSSSKSAAKDPSGPKCTVVITSGQRQGEHCNRPATGKDYIDSAGTHHPRCSMAAHSEKPSKSYDEVMNKKSGGKKGSSASSSSTPVPASSVPRPQLPAPAGRFVLTYVPAEFAPQPAEMHDETGIVLVMGANNSRQVTGFLDRNNRTIVRDYRFTDEQIRAGQANGYTFPGIASAVPTVPSVPHVPQIPHVPMVPQVPQPSVPIPQVPQPSVPVPQVPQPSVPQVPQPSIPVPPVPQPVVPASYQAPYQAAPPASSPAVGGAGAAAPAVPSVPMPSIPAIPQPSVPVPAIPQSSVPMPSMPMPAIPQPAALPPAMSIPGVNS